MDTLTSQIASNNLTPCAWANFEQRIGQWFVIHTKSRQEKALAQALDAMKVAYYLPLVKKTIYHGKRKLTSQLPLFPGYLFLRGELDDAYLADRTKRIARVIRMVDQDLIHNELRNIHIAITKDATLAPYPYLKKGIWVEVRSGPFQGIRGIIESRTKSDRLVLQIKTLGQATSLEIDGDLLEPLE